MDTYENIKREILEAYEAAVQELFLLKVSGEVADKALERELQADVQDLWDQLNEIHLLIEGTEYELDPSKFDDVDAVGMRPSGAQGVVARDTQENDE